MTHDRPFLKIKEIKPSEQDEQDENEDSDKQSSYTDNGSPISPYRREPEQKPKAAKDIDPANPLLPKNYLLELK
jgi:hypothetical protein